jgi:hypothetical protein
MVKPKVTAKQPNSKRCFVCGLKNQFGLKSQFYELENGALMARFFPADEHQSYPLDREVVVVARINSENRRTFAGTGEIVLEDGSVAVEGQGRYLKMDLSRITDFDFDREQWQVIERRDDPLALDR